MEYVKTTKPLREAILRYQPYKSYDNIEDFIDAYIMARTGKSGMFWSDVERNYDMYGEVLDVVNRVTGVFVDKQAKNPLIYVGYGSGDKPEERLFVVAVVPAQPRPGYDPSNTHIFTFARPLPQTRYRDRGAYK